jgi:hypothetical protein
MWDKWIWRMGSNATGDPICAPQRIRCDVMARVTQFDNRCHLPVNCVDRRDWGCHWSQLNDRKKPAQNIECNVKSTDRISNAPLSSSFISILIFTMSVRSSIAECNVNKPNRILNVRPLCHCPISRRRLTPSLDIALEVLPDSRLHPPFLVPNQVFLPGCDSR